MPIVWREAMSVGNDTVDNGHKLLIDMINQFEIATGKSSINHDKIREVLLGLVAYAREYFAHEEQLQLSVHYPFYESHCRIHREILHKLATILVAYTQAHGAERNQITEDISRLLKEWLVEHILQADQRMKPYVSPPV